MGKLGDVVANALVFQLEDQEILLKKLNSSLSLSNNGYLRKSAVGNHEMD